MQRELQTNPAAEMTLIMRHKRGKECVAPHNVTIDTSAVGRETLLANSSVRRVGIE